MHKMVNGIAVELTAEEIAQESAKEAAWNSQAVDRALQQIRKDRDLLLAESDIKVMVDRWFAMSDSKKTEWSLYRQVLRDLPASTTDPFNPVWPVKPL